MSTTRRIFVVGATGAQGLPVCRGLTQDGAYSLRVLTRDRNSARAQELAKLGDVEFVEGTFASEEDLRKGFRGCWGAFVNIDGFNTGEKTEIYWTIRAYELAIEEGIKFYVHGNLDFSYKKGGYNPEVHAAHYDGKGRMGEWILFQNQDNKDRMGAALFTTGPYIEMNFNARTIMTPRIQDEAVIWAVPLGDGAIPFVALDDCAYYVRWIFDHPERSNGMDLEVAIDHITYRDLTAAFTKVTGHAAQWMDLPIETYMAHMPFPTDAPSGYNADPNDLATITWQQSFTGFWTLWQRSGGNKGIIQRDYVLLDEIFPSRIRTAEEWIRREDEKLKAQGKGGIWESLQEGNMGMILKLSEDGGKGRL
jgi:hypothetical protein